MPSPITFAIGRYIINDAAIPVSAMYDRAAMASASVKGRYHDLHSICRNKSTNERSEVGYYDVIYMDIQMPIMDGYETVREIRNSKHQQAKTIPIIAVTANVFAEDVEKARLCGMNGHIGKPIDRAELIFETNILLNKTNGE